MHYTRSPATAAPTTGVPMKKLMYISAPTISFSVTDGNSVSHGSGYQNEKRSVPVLPGIYYYCEFVVFHPLFTVEFISSIKSN